MKIQKIASSAASNKPTEPPTYCIVCKKNARPNSIYCSDDCIRKHAQNALNAFSAKSPEPPAATNSQIKITPDDKKKKSKGLFEDLLSMADRKPKIERVYVFERKTGRMLTGSNAPTTHNLKKWLQDNPTFEVVQPGSQQAIEIEKKQKQRVLHTSSPNLIRTSSNPDNVIIHHNSVTSPPSSAAVKATSSAPAFHRSESLTTQMIGQAEIIPTAKPVKQLIEHARSSPTSPRPSTPKQLQKYPQQVSIKPDKPARSESKDHSKPKEKTPSRQRHSSESSSSKKHGDSAASSSDPEPIRLNVRRTLKEQLLLRIKQVVPGDDAALKQLNTTKLSADEVDSFVTATEAEMFNYFHQDIGTKYKAKYRSLMFNIKDRKNHTLFARICAKHIQPKQLVRMSPDELASQELAQWRENETKHQLEMIKKSELDLLSCAKNYVLKTHKGEEVIEGKSGDRVDLDLTIPVEDVVSVLNNSSGLAGEESASTQTPPSTRKDLFHSSDVDTPSGQNTEPHSASSSTPAEQSKHERSKSLSKEKERDRDRDRDKHKGRDRHREHEHSHEHDHDRDRGQDRSRHKSRDRHHEHSHSHERDPESSRSRHQSKDRHREKSHSRKRSHSHSRSRSHSKEKRHKSAHRDEHRDRDERDRGRDREYHHEIKEEMKRKSINATPPLHAQTKVISKEKNHDSNSSVQGKAAANTPPPLGAFSLIDKILESEKTVEEAANLTSHTEKNKESERDRGKEKEKGKEKDKDKEKEKEKEKAVVTQSTPLATAKSRPAGDTPLTAQTSIDSDQEPTSTVSIATPPHDPYGKYFGVNSPASESAQSYPNTIWSGTINMIDVASFQILLQSVVGNSLNLGKLLAKELDVVGRIGPDTVWDYISKIKKSPNKEIVIIRLVPISESETTAYTILYKYLEKRNRLGVIKTIFPQVKDFYIYPLAAGKQMPSILQPVEPVDFYDDPLRPDILVGIVIRVIGKRSSAAVAASAIPPNVTSTSSLKYNRRGNESDSLTPPGSPKRKKRTHPTASRDDDIDLDAIIKAPIVAKSSKPAPMSAITDDADEPYSPGDSSDDNTPLPPTVAPVEDELKRKMDELNRQIAAQEMEIAGLLQVKPSHFASSSSNTTSTVLANISIPSNLSQILASIKGKPDGQQISQAPSQIAPPPPVIGSINKTSAIEDDEEYNPEDLPYKNTEKSSSSRLAQLSEAELLSMVPDDMIEPTSKPSMHYEEPPPPGV